jgi:hypothetical protein
MMKVMPLRKNNPAHQGKRYFKCIQLVVSYELTIGLFLLQVGTRVNIRKMIGKIMICVTVVFSFVCLSMIFLCIAS